MNRKFVVLTALAAGLVALDVKAQVSPAPPQPAGPAAPAAQQPAAAAVVPQAIPAKIAIISFQQAAVQTNEGQQAVLTVQKKYEPQKAKIDGVAAEVDSLKKQLQAAPATMTDQERASREKSIDIKEKQYQRDVDDAQTAYQADLEEAVGKVMQKVDLVMQTYVKLHGFTLVLDVSNQQQSAVMWIDPQTDITEAIINAYNVSSGVAPPPPAAPSASRPAPKPATPATPHTTTTPKPPTK
jgi:Skp family chaperone for outer membrane proteins